MKEVLDMSNRQIKQALLIKYGCNCMLCRRKLKPNERTLHHIIPICNGGETTEENGAILCEPCQKIIHTFDYEEDGYRKLTEKILKNKRGR